MTRSRDDFPDQRASTVAGAALLRGMNGPDFIEQSRRIIESHRFWLKRDLIPFAGTLEEQALALFHAKPVILSSGNEPDPLINYGNQSALNLWEISWEKLRGMPGRLTAEPMERSARDAFLKRVRENGFVTDYEGVRISRRGRRFWISSATVWNILDPDGKYLGQAAAFHHWKELEPEVGSPRTGRRL